MNKTQKAFPAKKEQDYVCKGSHHQQAQHVQMTHTLACMSTSRKEVVRMVGDQDRREDNCRL